jgi:hypothetical protein
MLLVNYGYSISVLAVLDPIQLGIHLSTYLSIIPPIHHTRQLGRYVLFWLVLRIITPPYSHSLKVRRWIRTLHLR